jgi:hypothetical protein
VLLDALAAMAHRPVDAQLAALLDGLLALHGSAAGPVPSPSSAPAGPRSAVPAISIQLQLSSSPSASRSPSPPPHSRGQVPPYANGFAGPAGAPAATSGAVAEPVLLSPLASARLLQSLSRVGYAPQPGALAALLAALSPERLRLRPASPSLAGAAATRAARAAALDASSGLSLPLSLSLPLQPGEEGAGSGAEGGEEPLLALSSARDAQAVACAVRALERMGRREEAMELRTRFRAHVEGLEVRLGGVCARGRGHCSLSRHALVYPRFHARLAHSSLHGCTAGRGGAGARAAQGPGRCRSAGGCARSRRG